MKKVILTLGAAMALLASCEPSVAFLEPQPVGSPSVVNIQPALTGWYAETDDPGSTLLVGKDFVFSKTTREMRVSRHWAENTDGVWIKGNKVRIDSLDRQFPFRAENDSLVLIDEYCDTIFNMASGDVLKEKAGLLFLNLKHEENSWEVLQLSPEQDSCITIAAISPAEDVDNLRSVTPVKEVVNADNDSREYIARPSEQEFTAFIEQGGFSVKKRYKKIN